MKGPEFESRVGFQLPSCAERFLRAPVLFVGHVDEVVGFFLRDQLNDVLDRRLVADHQDAAIAVELELGGVEMALPRERPDLVHGLFVTRHFTRCLRPVGRRG